MNNSQLWLNLQRIRVIVKEPSKRIYSIYEVDLEYTKSGKYSASTQFAIDSALICARECEGTITIEYVQREEN